ncbi:hypothetical protein [Microbacterium sp. NPDC089696]|uniref:hypothetical protein n=1 Tax=Microbacterium sp. NPDC089696 TaxID=3364199 RepID=UPI0038168996
MRTRRTVISGALALALIVTGGAPAFAVDMGATDSSLCADLAKEVLSEEGVVADNSGTVSFACLGNQVVATVDANTAQSQRFTREVEFEGAAQTSREADPNSSSASDPLGEPLVVPFSATAALADPCITGEYQREVRSELEDFIYGCARYGEYNKDTGAIIWERSITYEWTLYTGWPSAQNKLRTIPSVGSPTMSGTFTSYKQNGILPPDSLALTAFTNVGNTTTSGWNVGSLNTGGQFSVWMGDVVIKDTSKNYEEYFEGYVPSHRFTCDSGVQRCYYPNGQEAGL